MFSINKILRCLAHAVIGITFGVSFCLLVASFTLVTQPKKNSDPSKAAIELILIPVGGSR